MILSARVRACQHSNNISCTATIDIKRIAVEQKHKMDELAKMTEAT